MFPSVSHQTVPFITVDEMREVDRAMMEDFGISLIQMMENAGRGLAELARRRFLGGDASDRRVVVLVGTGGNGGGGLVCARRLHGWGRRSGCLRLRRTRATRASPLSSSASCAASTSRLITDGTTQRRPRRT